MTVAYEIYLDDNGGQHLLVPDRWEKLTWARRVNSVGSFAITYAAGVFPRSMFNVDYRIEVWRQVTGTPKKLVFIGFCRWVEQGYSNGNQYITIGGPDTNDLLQRAIVAYDAGTTYTAKGPGYAGDIMKDFVSENLSAATPDPARNHYVMIAPDANDGYSLTSKEATRRNVLPVLQEIAAESAQRGYKIYFDITWPRPSILVGTGPGGYSTWLFSTFAGQRGHDRTYPEGDRPLVLSAENETLLEPVFREDWMGEWNVVYACGQGQAENREVVELIDAARVGGGFETVNRREEMYDGNNIPVGQTAALTEAGYQRLYEGRPKKKFTAKLGETDTMRYGVDVDFGDRVTASFAGQSLDVDLLAVAATVAGGAEKLDIRLEYMD